jgi:hypothetical protein
MKTEETTKNLVNQITAPILEALAENEARVLSLENPVVLENPVASLSIAKLLADGFVTVERVMEMAEGFISAKSYEEIATPYSVLPIETMAEILTEVNSGKFESH